MSVVLGAAIGGSSAVALGQQQSDPYAVLRDAWSPYVQAGDPYGFPMKVAAITESKYKFWRGTKDLYYRWAKQHTTDWLADDAAYVICHGDLHPGNIGTYAVEPGKLAFGWVDFDDSARLPFQLELLHGLISLNLVAETNGMTLAAADRAKVTEAMLGRYREALTSEAKSAAADLAGNVQVRKMLAKERKPFDGARKELLDDTNRFHATITSKSSKVKEVLQDASEQADAIAAALAAAIDESPDLKAQFRLRGTEEVRAAMKGVVLRSRVGSSGSQGLRKCYVLLANPLTGIDGDAVVYLKQQIPSAAERAGVVPLDERTPAQRCVANMQAALDTQPWVCGTMDVNGASYWISLREPWSDELDTEDVGNLAELLEMAEIWGAVTGAAHRRTTTDATAIAGRLTPDLVRTLDARALEYNRQLKADFATVTADARAGADIEQVRKALTAAGKTPAN
ncbi:MAG TPA: DUF2252 family protein [Tepidisphaeraceae bacterium]|jgi:uncharacterized protein (DUF2252 family)|nr:DUF2252 family protein [Tepidisphaeraceae bacterium]